MKQTFSILLLLIFLFTISGYYWYFSFKQHLIKEEIEREIIQGMKEEDLTELVLPDNNHNGFFWIKKNKEFMYRGDMYDVVKIFKKSQNIHYICFRDKKEEKLLDEYKKENQSRKDTEKKVKWVWGLKFFKQTSTKLHISISVNMFYPILVTNFKSHPISIPSPPPKPV